MDTQTLFCCSVAMLALPETIFPRPLNFSNFGTSERLQSRPNLTSCQPVLEHQSALNNPSASRKANTLIIPLSRIAASPRLACYDDC